MVGVLPTLNYWIKLLLVVPVEGLERSIHGWAFLLLKEALGVFNLKLLLTISSLLLPLLKFIKALVTQSYKLYVLPCEGRRISLLVNWNLSTLLWTHDPQPLAHFTL